MLQFITWLCSSDERRDKPNSRTGTLCVLGLFNRLMNNSFDSLTYHGHLHFINRKLKHTKLENPAQGHPASKDQGLGLEIGQGSLPLLTSMWMPAVVTSKRHRRSWFPTANEGGTYLEHTSVMESTHITVVEDERHSVESSVK